MHETRADLESLQRLLDDSCARSGAHLRSIGEPGIRGNAAFWHVEPRLMFAAALASDVDVGTLLVGEAITFPMELIRSALKAVTPGGLRVSYMTHSEASGGPSVPAVFKYETHWSTTGEAVRGKACGRETLVAP